MYRVLYGWAANALGILVAAAMNLVDYDGRFFTLLLAALAFGIINVLVRPIVTVLSLPAIILSLGLFVFVINAFMLYLTDIVVPHFQTLGFWHTVGAALVIGVVNAILHGILRDVTREQIQGQSKKHVA